MQLNTIIRAYIGAFSFSCASDKQTTATTKTYLSNSPFKHAHTLVNIIKASYYVPVIGTVIGTAVVIIAFKRQEEKFVKVSLIVRLALSTLWPAAPFALMLLDSVGTCAYFATRHKSQYKDAATELFFGLGC